MPFCSHDCFRGTPNKISGALKEAILEAAEEAGGEHTWHRWLPELKACSLYTGAKKRSACLTVLVYQKSRY